jgi:tetratricopeptide (TPR) repeat protein
VEARTAKLGADHPDTLTSKNNLALLYQAQNRHDLAEPLFREVVEGSRQKLGPTHPDTQQRIRNLILCYEQIGQPARAGELRRELEQILQGLSLGRR